MIMMKKRMFLKLMAVAMLLSTTVQAMAEKEFYGVSSYNDGNETWTYYYDTQKASRGGVSSPGDGLLNTSNTVTVVFDASVADYKPTSMTGWFSNCSELTTITGLQYLNTSNVWLMNTMFMGCSSLKSIDLSHFDTSNVTTMEAMFTGCSSLTKLDLTSFDTSNVTNMEGMFAYCSSLTIVDLSSFNTAKVTNMSGMFAECTSLRTIYADDARWTTAAVTNGSDVFYNCDPLVGGNGTAYYDSFIEDVSYACVDKTGQSGYFTQKDGPALPTPEPYAALSDDNTVLTFYYDGKKSSRGGMSVGPFTLVYHEGEGYDPNTSWYAYRESITTVKFDESFANCTSITSTSYWFHNLKNLSSIVGLGNLKTDNVTDMSYMFSSISSSYISGLDMSGFNTSKVTNMHGMFAHLLYIQNLDVSSFDTSNVTDMGSMFLQCGGLRAVDVSGFNTSKVKDMSSMFEFCPALQSIYLNGFNTENVTTMTRMFQGCESFKILDLSSFSTKSLKYISYMFMNCSNLTTIYVGKGWDNSAITLGSDVFKNCNKLVGGAGTTYSSSHVDYTYARIDYGGLYPAYFTEKKAIEPGADTDPEPYAALSNGNTVLTFYYDGKKASREGLGVTEMVSNSEYKWSMYSAGIKKVVFDKSMEECTTLTSTSCFFVNFINLTTIEGIENLKNCPLTDMTSMFYGCNKLTTLDLSPLNTSNVTSMYLLFYSCSSLQSVNLSNFDTSNVTTMYGMFDGCSSLKSIDLSSFNTSKVEDMANMFCYCSSLNELDVTGFNVESVKWMQYFFNACSLLKTLDLTKFKPTSAQNMSGMFWGCKSLTTIYCNDTWNCKTSTSMFYECPNVKGAIAFDEGKITVAYANPTTGYFTPSSALGNFKPYAVFDNGTLTFYYDAKKEERGGYEVGPFTSTEIRWGGNEKKITSVVFDESFANCTSITSTAYWFNGCDALTTITGLGNLSTEHVVDMHNMFTGCQLLLGLDLSLLNTSMVSDMRNMFTDCRSLKSLDVSGFNMENVTLINQMFQDCSSLKSINLSGFNTSNVSNLSYLFAGCSSLESLDVTSFNTSKVTNMKCMFSGCSSLTSIFCNDTWVCSESTDMFAGCTSLEGAMTYDASMTDATYANPKNGYFTPVSSNTPEPYAVYDNGTLTFYYDCEKGIRGGYDVGPFTRTVVSSQPMINSGWFEQRNQITSVVFDSSFKDCKTLTSTAYWFDDCSNLTTITGLENLYTGNVTDMRMMFYYCKKLESLDLRAFNTSNVTSMDMMFYYCQKLKTLDLCAFNTFSFAVGN